MKVQYKAGQMLSLSEDSQVGSSGGCALNQAGEVVGIMAWTFGADDRGGVGVIVLVYGEEFKAPEKVLSEKPEEARR